MSWAAAVDASAPLGRSDGTILVRGIDRYERAAANAIRSSSTTRRSFTTGALRAALEKAGVSDRRPT